MHGCIGSDQTKEVSMRSQMGVTDMGQAEGHAAYSNGAHLKQHGEHGLICAGKRCIFD